MAKLFFITIIVLSPFSFSQELIVRADKHSPKQLPLWSKMPSATPKCSNGGFIATEFSALFGEENLKPALFTTSTLISEPFKSDISVSDLFIDDDGSVVFSKNFRGGTEGVFKFNSLGVLENVVSPHSFPDVIAMSRPSVVLGKVLFRALHKNGLHSIYWGEEKLFEETNNTAYLYLPTVKKNQIALKIGFGKPGDVDAKNQDKIVSVFGGELKIVAVDQDTDSDSEFLSFDNSPVPDGEGGVSFIAEHQEFGRSLWLYKNKEFHLMFSSKTEKLEYFSPSVNKHGDVVFRTISSGKRKIQLLNSETKGLTTLMVQGDPVKGNEKNLRVIDRRNWPAFSGSPCITDDKSVYVHAVLESSVNYSNKGSGIFKFSF